MFLVRRICFIPHMNYRQLTQIIGLGSNKKSVFSPPICLLSTEKLKPPTCNFNYTPEEISIILNKLNTLTEEQLKYYKISKKAQAGFFRQRANIGSYLTIHDLLDANGIGEKVAKKLCDTALNQDPEIQPLLNNARQVESKSPRNIPVRPFVDPVYTSKTCETLVSISVNPYYLTWTHLHCKERKILQVDTYTFDKIDQGDPVKTHEQILAGICRLPDADIYVFDHNPNNLYINKGRLNTNRTEVNYLVHNAMIKGIIITLCQPKAMEGIYFLNDELVLKLFNLKIDSKRRSSIEITTKLITNQIKFDWLEFPELTRHSRNVLLRRPYFIKNMMCDSLLSAVTFLEAVVNENSTVKILYNLK